MLPHSRGGASEADEAVIIVHTRTGSERHSLTSTTRAATDYYTQQQRRTIIHNDTRWAKKEECKGAGWSHRAAATARASRGGTMDNSRRRAAG